jgi:hypothetical protein
VWVEQPTEKRCNEHDSRPVAAAANGDQFSDSGRYDEQRRIVKPRMFDRLTSTSI